MLVATIFVALPATAGTMALPAPTEIWTRAETAHVRVYSNASEAEAIEAAKNLELLRGALVRVVQSGEMPAAPPVTAFLFRDDREFDRYRDAISHGSRAVGLFVKNDWGNMIAATRHGADHLGAIDHEYVHALLASVMPGAPLWFNEGLAELFSNTETDGQTVRVGLPIRQHLEWLRSHRMMPIDQLFSVTTSSREYRSGLRQGTFYAESWLLVHELLIGSGDREALQKYLVAIDRGSSSSDALKTSFVESPEELDRRLGDYLERSTLPWIAIPVHADLPPPAVTRASRADILYDLGNLLYRGAPDDLAAAIEHYRAAIEADPGHAGANSMLGTILYGEGRKSEAATYLARATRSMTSTDYLPYLLRGQNILDQTRGVEIGFGADARKPPGSTGPASSSSGASSSTRGIPARSPESERPTFSSRATSVEASTRSRKRSSRCRTVPTSRSISRSSTSSRTTRHAPSGPSFRR